MCWTSKITSSVNNFDLSVHILCVDNSDRVSFILQPNIRTFIQTYIMNLSYVLVQGSHTATRCLPATPPPDCYVIISVIQQTFT